MCRGMPPVSAHEDFKEETKSRGLEPGKSRDQTEQERMKTRS